MSKPVCIFQSPIFTQSGYGGWAMATAKSLLRYDKFDLKIISTPWGNCSKKVILSDSDIEDAAEKLLVQKILRGPLTAQPEVFIQMTIPNEFMAPAKYNIGMQEINKSEKEFVDLNLFALIYFLHTNVVFGE